MSKKTLIIIGSSIIGVLVLLLIVVWLITVFGNHYYTYEKVEQKIIEATEKYYKNYPEMLPVGDGKYNLSYSALVEKEYIKPLNEMLKDGDSCTAEILVINQNNNYSYVPKLNCGEAYETRELYKKVLVDNTVVTEGSGLYQAEDGTYYFRGKVDNNYVALGVASSRKKENDILWQIISINPDNTIRMKALSHSEERTPYDDRYNENRGSFFGYNDFKDSILKDFLIKMDKEDQLLTKEQKSKLVATQLCAGKRSSKDKTTDGSSECSVKTDEFMIFGTMLPYEFMRASLDQNCKKATDYSCANFNFLATNNTSSEWSSIGDSSVNYYAYNFTGITYETSTTKSEKYVYPVVTVSEYAFIKSGSGTESDPYRLFKKETK